MKSLLIRKELTSAASEDVEENGKVFCTETKYHKQIPVSKGCLFMFEDRLCSDMCIFIVCIGNPHIESSCQ